MSRFILLWLIDEPEGPCAWKNSLSARLLCYWPLLIVLAMILLLSFIHTFLCQNALDISGFIS